MAYYFNLPIIDDLTPDQQAAVDETDAFALSGGPGTGKSVVCLWRHIRNYAIEEERSLLLTYTKTLEHYLKQTALSESPSAAENIDRTFNWLTHKGARYDEIIIDEGQDVGIDKYKKIKEYSGSVCYGADVAQSLYEQGCTLDQLAQLLPENEEYTLNRNFRNSREILEFTRSVFPDFFIPQETVNNAKETGLKPIMKITGWSDDNELNQMMNIINDFAGDTHNIGILVPTKKDVREYYKRINNALQGAFECTRYEGEMDTFNGLSGIHITTFKSSKGTEFDTVIIPKFDSLDWNIKNLDIISEKDYYVAFTRSKTNLFLICKKNPRKVADSTFEIV